MFVTIAPAKREKTKGLFGRLRRSRNIGREVRQRELLGGKFLDIRVRDPKDLLDPRAEMPRITWRNALIGSGWELPFGFRPAVTSGDIEKFQAQILCNTAVDILRRKTAPRKRILGILDRNCKYPNLLEPLIMTVAEILVMTEDGAAYGAYVEKLYEEYGAPVTIVEDFRSLNNAVLLLSFGENCPVGLNRPALSTSDFDISEVSGHSLLDVELPEANAVIPPSIDRWEFYTAVHKFFGPERLKKLRAAEQSPKCQHLLENTDGF